MGVRTRQHDGQWYVFINHQTRRKAHKVGQKRAAKKLRKELDAILQLQGWEGVLERLGKSSGDTVKSFGQQWLNSPLNSWAASTRESYTIAFNNHIVPALGKKKIGEVSRADVIKLIEGLVRADYGAGWVNTVTVTLSGIFVRAMDAGLVAINPCRELGRYKRMGKKEAKPNPLTEEEAKQALEKAQKDTYPLAYEWFLVASTSGLRPGEQAGLEWRDLDIEACSLKVERTFSKFRIGKPKSGKSRTVDIPPQTVEVLKSLRASLGVIPLPSLPIFQNLAGGRMNAGTVRRMVKRCAPRPIRAHDLRHTYATLRLEAGDSIFDVSGQLGHSNCEITAKVYAHWIPGKQKEQIAALGERLVGEG